MNKKGIVGAMAAGAVIGVVMGIVFDPINDRQHRKISRHANNVFKTIGAIVDDVVSM